MREHFIVHLLAIADQAHRSHARVMVRVTCAVASRTNTKLLFVMSIALAGGNGGQWSPRLRRGK